MATNKTISPTNVTVSIPALGDQPDASVFSNCIDKAIDGINTLNSHMTTLSSPDLNNLKESGLYYVGGASHSPGGSTNWWGHVVVIANSTGTEVKQIFYNNGSDAEYTRYYRNNTWSGWNTNIVVNHSNATSYTIPNLNETSNSFGYFILMGGTGKNTPFIYHGFVNLDATNNEVTLTLIGGVAPSGIAATYSRATGTLVITTTETLYGGIRLLWFGN